MSAKFEHTRDVTDPGSGDTNTNTCSDPTNTKFKDALPIYYNSEPSSQPPKYPDNKPTSKPKPTSQSESGASASTIAAVLGSDYIDLDAQRRAARKKKTLRERWKEFKERNFHNYDASEDQAGAASAAEWNVQGGRLGGGLASPYRRNRGKWK